MLVDKSLLIKGIAGVAAIAGVSVGISYREEIGDLFRTKEQIERRKINGILDSLGLKEDCRLGESEDPTKNFTKECALEEEALREINFSNKGKGVLKIDGDIPTDLKIKIEGTKEDITFSFTGITSGSDIKLFGEKGQIVLKGDKKFKNVNGKLTKVSTGVDDKLKSKLEEFNKQLGIVNAPQECRFDEMEEETTVECDVASDKLKKMVFSNKGTEDLKIVGEVSSGLKLKVEKDAQNVMSVSFTGIATGSEIKLFGDKSKGKIVVKTDKKFKVKDGKLTKDSTGVEATLKSKLEEFNKQLGKVNAPQECRFDEAEGETSVECNVTSEDLKKMVFSREKGKVTYREGEDFKGMKLILKTHKEITHSGYGNEARVMYLTFKEYDKTVKLVKGNKEIVSLVKGTNPEFEIYKEEKSEAFLVRELWDLDYISTTLGLKNCSIDKGKTQGGCEIDPVVRTIKVKKTSGEDYEELTVTDGNSKFELHKDQEGFNQGFKFVFKGTTVTSNSVTLESNGEYEFKWKLQSKTKTGYLSRK